MSFEQFAMSHGLVINGLELNKWVRVPTDDKPRKLNGAYIWDGQFGAVINFALHDKHVTYKSNEPVKFDPLAKARRLKSDKERLERQNLAVDKASNILKSSKIATHPYLDRKGFTNARGYVWKGNLVIPMRIGGLLVGCQLIREDGDKKFLTGQITKGASLVLNQSGRDIVCEGFATGLSVKRALKHLGVTHKVHVCFSASNMVLIASSLKHPIVVADNDEIGIRCAEKIAPRYWLGADGEDFNDSEVRLGTPLISSALSVFL